jgi:DNA polymerase eta
MNILATELHLRLSEARELTPGLWVSSPATQFAELCAKLNVRDLLQPKTITFTHRSADYVIRSHQMAFPFTSRLDIAYINKFGDRLLRTAIGEKIQTLGPDSKIGPYSNIQLSFSGMEKLEEGQKGIERFFSQQAVTENKRPAAHPQDGPSKKLKTRPYSNAPENQVLVIDEDEETIDSDVPDSNSGAFAASDVPPALPKATCDLCSKTLEIPSHTARALAPAFDQEAVANALRKEQEEHADWHVARAILEADRHRSRFGSHSGRSSKSAQSDKGKKTKGKDKLAQPAAATLSKVPASKAGQQSLRSFFG